MEAVLDEANHEAMVVVGCSKMAQLGVKEDSGPRKIISR